jgi:hypothetical protein
VAVGGVSALSEWLADIGAAADELGYGILQLEPHRIELVARQSDGLTIIESRALSGKLLRERLVPIPHQSGSPYTRDYMRTVER